MSKYNDLTVATTKMREGAEEVKDLDLFMAAVTITCERWFTEKGYPKHMQTKVMQEITEGFRVAEK